LRNNSIVIGRVADVSWGFKKNRNKIMELSQKEDGGNSFSKH
jgi:hypothetical protein